MFKNDIHLRSELTEIVDVYTSDGNLITQGELNIRPNKAPVLELKNAYNIGNLDSTVFKACSYNGIWYMLLDCSVYKFGKIYPKIIVKSDSHSGEFKTIKFVTQGLSQWFDNSKFLDSGDDYITKYLNTNEFMISISDRSFGKITISSENWWQTGGEKDGLFTISQKTAICIEAKDSSFSCESALDYIHRINDLLSILIGYSLTIEYCFDVQKKRKNSIYFVNIQDDDKKFENQAECLVHENYLFSENRWNTVFKSAFETNKSNFFDIWSRLPGLSDFSKYWEYELLACVSLIDRYSSKFSEESDEKIPERQFSKIKKNLKEEVRKYTLESDPGSLKQSVIDSIVEQIKVIKNTKYPSFQSCFECAYNSMSEDFRNIIRLSDEDFRHLKKIRDKIAHGDTPETKFDGSLTHEATLQNKLLVILYCWALKDFGIPESDCIKFLSNWMHPMIRSASLDKTALDKKIGRYRLIPLNKRDFVSAEKAKFGTLALEYSGKGKNYKYRKDLEQVMNDWYMPQTDKPRNLEEYLTLHLGTDSVHSLCYVGSVYIENGDQSHCTQGVCILNPPNDLIDKNRFWEYDTNANKWHQPLKDK